MLAPSLTAAQTVAEWIPVVGGNYHDPANWSTNAVPGATCCPSDSAQIEIPAGPTQDIFLPHTGVLTPEDLLVKEGSIEFEVEPGGDGDAELNAADQLMLDGAKLILKSGVSIAAARTDILGDGAAVTELSFFPGSSGDLGPLAVGGALGERDSLVTISTGAEVLAGTTTINLAGAASHTAAVQATGGVFRQTSGASLTVGTDVAGGVAILAAASGGEVHTGSGDLTVLQNGRVLNIGSEVHFGGDVLLQGGAFSYSESSGSGATRSFATGSTISIATGAQASFDLAPLLLDSGQTLSLDEAGGLLDAQGDIVFGQGGVLSLAFDTVGPTAAAKVQSQGAVTLDGQLAVSLLPGGPTPQSGDQYPLLSAAAGFNGSFDSFDLPSLSGIGWQLAIVGDTLWLNAVAALPGDYNADGFVNEGDYALWRNTLSSQTELAADGNNNGTVDAADLAVWLQNFGATQAATFAGVAVPEPCGAVFFATIALGLCCRRAAASVVGFRRCA